VGEVAERLAGLTVACTSPDGNISARIQNGQLVELAFRPGSYERYTEPDLAHQLARTATLLYIGHEREKQRVIAAAGLHRPTDPAQARDDAQRRFLRAVQNISVAGTGPGELVSFEIHGMANWACRIAPGTLRWIPEPELIAEVGAAAAELLRQSRFEKILLKNECFGAQHLPLVTERIGRAAQTR
jgi:hypothetical protein